MKGFINTVGSILILIVVMAGIRGAFYWWEVQDLSDPTPAPVLVTPADVEIEPTQTWTNGKQHVYEGCIGERPYGVSEDEMSSYCQCATNYTFDTYGMQQIIEWGNAGSMPQYVVDEAVARCA